MPAGPIKCAGARRRSPTSPPTTGGSRACSNDIRVVLVLPTPGMFGVPEFAAVLEQVVSRYGIEVHKNSELVEVDPHSRRAVIADNAASTKDELDYDLMHVVPPQSAPNWIKQQPAGRPDQPRRLRRDRQAHHAAHALSQRLRAR